MVYQDKNWADDEEETSASRKKIILPEEDIDNIDDTSDNDSDTTDDDMDYMSADGLVILDLKVLAQEINKKTTCRFCKLSSVKIVERPYFRQGLGVKLYIKCDNVTCESNIENDGFFSTSRLPDKKQYSINLLSVLAFRAIGKERQAALKLFSIMDLGRPISKYAWSRHTKELVTASAEVAEQNMATATLEVKTKKTILQQEFAVHKHRN